MSSQSPSPLARYAAHAAVGVAAASAVRRLVRPGLAAEVLAAIAIMYIHQQLDAPLAARFKEIGF